MSTFGWLDHSESERRRALDVVGLFREQGTVDELGIGLIRDAFADALFPGTSTLQTRARYFLFVAWIYQKLERDRVASGQAATRARRMEIALIDALAESDDRGGIIGIDARKSLKLLPSNIYWRGLETWGIRLFRGTQPQYYRWLDRFYSLPQRIVRNEDGEPIDGRAVGNWHPTLPLPPAGWPDQAALSLSRLDAQYLRERIITTHPRTLLAVLVKARQSVEGVGLPWDLRDTLELPSALEEQLHHARLFSEAIHGAALLYNLMLARASRRKELVESHATQLSAWEETIKRSEFSRWDRNRFWELVRLAGARVRPATQRFVEDWFRLTLPPSQATQISSSKRAETLIRDREARLKGARARLGNPRALELWGGASAARQLDYRWGGVSIIVTDILKGLSRRA